MSLPVNILLTSSGIAALNIRPVVFQRVKDAQSVAIITTASREHKANNKHAATTRDIFVNYGIPQVDFVDVEFEDATALRDYDVIYIIGGHPFYLMLHLQQSGAADILREMHAARTVFLIGSSAGAVVLGPDMRIVSAFDPDLQAGYEPMPGIGLLPYTVLPHINRWREKLPDLEERLAAFAQETGLTVETIPDNEALLVDSSGAVIQRL